MLSLAVAVLGAACGSVQFDPPDGGEPTDAGRDGVDDSTRPDAWASHCAPAATITNVESPLPGYGSSCIHGSWTLSALTGSSVPSTANQPGNTVAVMPVPIAAGANPLNAASTFAVHVSGSAQENRAGVFGFANLGAALNSIPNAATGTVDASAYTGIQFSGKLVAGALGIRVGVANLYTDPVGGLCGVSGTMSCYDDPSVALQVGTGWTRYQVPFSQLTQLGFGNPSPLGASFPRDHITRIGWMIVVPATGPTEPWDLMIDDVSFY